MITDSATVFFFDVLGQDRTRNLSPSLPLLPYKPAATMVVRSLRPGGSSGNPLNPFLNGFRLSHPSYRPSNSGGNPPFASFSSHWFLSPVFAVCSVSFGPVCWRLSVTISPLCSGSNYTRRWGHHHWAVSSKPHTASIVWYTIGSLNIM